MEPGKLDKRLTLLLPTSVQNDAGETTTTYAAAEQFWADVRQQSAAEILRNGATTAQAAYAIRLRWRDDITAACQLLYQGRTLEISQVMEVGRQVELQLIAHEVRP